MEGEPCSSVSVVSDYGLGDRRLIPGRGDSIVRLASVSRPAVGPTQPPVQWLPGVLSQGLKGGRGVTLTIQPHLVPRSGMRRSYTSSPSSAFMALPGIEHRSPDRPVRSQTLYWLSYPAHNYAYITTKLQNPTLVFICNSEVTRKEFWKLYLLLVGTRVVRLYRLSRLVVGRRGGSVRRRGLSSRRQLRHCKKKVTGWHVTSKRCLAVKVTHYRVLPPTQTTSETASQKIHHETWCFESSLYMSKSDPPMN
jgi:hypothetical protein